MRINIIKYIGYYIIGFIIFRVIVSLTQTIILNICGLNKSIIDFLIKDNWINLIIYTVVYAILVIAIRLHDINAINKLNSRLYATRKEVQKNEK